MDFELERENDLPMSIDERDINNITNVQFNYEYLGGFFPCIFRGYYANATKDINFN